MVLWIPVCILSMIISGMVLMRVRERRRVLLPVASFSRTSAAKAASVGVAVMSNWQQSAMAAPQSARHVAARVSDIQWELGQAIEIMPIGVTITDIGGKILYTNPAEAEMHGYHVEELIGEDLGVFAPPELRHPLSIDDLKEMKPLRESVNVRKDGSIFPVRLIANVVKNAAGEPIAVVTTCEDISEHKQAAEKLRQHTRELSLLNHLSDALQECEQEAQTYAIIVEVCQKLFPDDSGCLAMMNAADSTMRVVDFWGNAPYRSAHAKTIHDEHELLCPHRLYNPYHECVSIPIVAADEILGLLSLCFQHEFQQETEIEQEMKPKQMVLTRVARHYALALTNLRLREQLKREAIHDPLTGLYNRRYMEEALVQEMSRAKRHQTQIGIFMLDIDHFKLFNDLHGHKVGDAVLRELGAFLRLSVRREDIACRYGGEEFLVILPNTSLEHARQRAEVLRSSVKQLTISCQEQRFQITVSIGVAVFPEHGFDIADVVNRSDLALYRAKESGRDNVMIAA